MEGLVQCVFVQLDLVLLWEYASEPKDSQYCDCARDTSVLWTHPSIIKKFGKRPALTRVSPTPNCFAFSIVSSWKEAKAFMDGLLSISAVHGAPYSEGKKVTKSGDLDTASNIGIWLARPGTPSVALTYLVFGLLGYRTLTSRR